MLECKNISLSIAGKTLFQLKELSIATGLYALVGRNGTGKSTFLNALASEIELEKGSIKIDGKAINTIAENELARKLSIVRSASGIFGEHTVKEVLALGRIPYQGMMARLTEEDSHIINDVIQNLELQEFSDRIYNTLSDGEKQLVMVGRAMVQDTPIILLDEPAAFLDLVNRKELIIRLKKLASEQRKLILFSTHHIEVLDQYCDGILLIHQKELKFIEDRTKFKSEIEQAFGLNTLK